MKLRIASPTKAFIVESTPDEMTVLTKLLTYTNTANQHLLKRHSQNHWFKSANPTGWEARKQELKDSVHNTLIFEENGQKYIRPGSIPYLVSEPSINLQIVNEIKYPTPKKIPWAKPLPFELYPYQEESWKKLLEARHGNVEITTGGGKSSIILKVCRESGFKTAIIVPSKSIFNEILAKFEHHFGKGNVGGFGAGKKKIGKRFTVCIGDSLVNIKPDSEEWKFFSKLDMIFIDESHTFGAETLEATCHSLFADVPYRLFCSGTQTRGAGDEMLLQSIIGGTVSTLTTKDAVNGGFICPHDYKIVQLESSNPNYNSSEPLEMKRIHYLKNRNIGHFVAKLANSSALANGSQTLILVEELSQIAMLVPLLAVPFAYAHSESKPERLLELGLQKVDPSESVDKFNRNEVKVLIGSSCIGVGVNIFPCLNTINWVGGASEVKTKQGAVGRSIRLGSQNPHKDKCLPKPSVTIWDFDVVDVPLLRKHLEKRIEYYQDSGSEIKIIKLK